MVESKVPNWNWFTHRVPDRKSKDISNTPDDIKNDIIPKWKPSLQPPISRPNLYQI